MASLLASQAERLARWAEADLGIREAHMQCELIKDASKQRQQQVGRGDAAAHTPKGAHGSSEPASVRQRGHAMLPRFAFARLLPFKQRAAGSPRNPHYPSVACAQLARWQNNVAVMSEGCKRMHEACR